MSANWLTMTRRGAAVFFALLLMGGLVSAWQRDGTMPNILAGYNGALTTLQARGSQHDLEYGQRAAVSLLINDRHIVHYNLGLALAQQNRPQEAIVELRRAVAGHPKYAVAWLTLAEQALKVGDRVTTEAALQAVLKLEPATPAAWLSLGRLRFEQQRMPDARDAYAQVVRLEPNNAQAHYNLALCLLQLDDRPGALRHLREALRLRPNYPRAQRKLVELQ